MTGTFLSGPAIPGDEPAYGPTGRQFAARLVPGDPASRFGSGRQSQRADGLLLAGDGGFVTEDLYLIAHDPQTGRLLIPGSALGVSLVGAELIGGLLAGCWSVQGGVLVADTALRLDLGLAEVSEQILRMAPTAAETWLRVLAASIPNWTREALVTSGVLHRVEWRNRLGRRRSAAVPADSTDAERRAVLLRNRLALGADSPTATARDAVLVGLIRAAGMQRLWLRDHKHLAPHATGMIARLAPDARAVLALCEHVIASMHLSR
ncbi:hypothetical protein Lfu02_01060 [Longispora fulva]|uniref:GPP34 family phosphoprotein n=1 Tax=Longispora fulva TaxID=619741 RepID=A0A8J7GDQ9_9ACTN|nr:GPP34 family phosphoprotein [Longispora fulva]MBG6136025.1 hypothetical protein [Longispora fulva]GIG55734.1 hypothetical protein Lfu02_01060 [Longispora fulva]